MTTAPVNQDTYRIPDDIAQAAILPESYGDEAGTTYPAFRWLRTHLPLGRAQLDGYDPILLVTKLDDVKSVELRTDDFDVTTNNRFSTPARATTSSAP